MSQPKVLIFSGYGLNCEEETKYAFTQAGAIGDIVHINDLIAGQVSLKDYQILAFPGGFSYGDDLGSGNAYAQKIRNHLWDDLAAFVAQNKLVIGICNGFQILSRLGLLPALDGAYGKQEAALQHNQSARYQVRWVDLKAGATKSPWLKGIDSLALPIAHGEGRLFAEPAVLKELQDKGLIALRYTNGEICNHFDLPANPNGSIDDIAALTDESGRIFGMMPHPERAIFFHQLPHWSLLAEKSKREGVPVPHFGPGLKLFENAVRYFE